MSSTEIGHKAERAASAYLEMRGFRILERNFRRPGCEIDIIACKNQVVQFVEVKYRRDDDQGSSLDTVTSAKLRQMARGAHIWVEETKWSGEYLMSVVEVSGSSFVIMGFIENAF